MKIENSFNLVNAQEFTGSVTLVPNDLLFGKYTDLSDSARMLYGILLDKLVSAYNDDLVDGNGDIYFTFSIKEIAQLNHCSISTAKRLKKELTDFGLLKSVQPGFGLPAKIYLQKVVKQPENSLRGDN